ncbi:MAG: TetR/AcrR family transcriptional regulator [Bdellovibrionales bacterium]|jgi:AcrR family transcriptional regulator|nr:TetR/AcrR family transcriptional regulator [Bdellovibrionales bacterium]
MAEVKRKGLATRSQILEVALGITSREGLSGLTIGELAKAVGMSKSGLFAHFRGKDSLELAVLEAAVERFIDTVMKPAFQKPRGEDRIRALIKNWLRFINGSDKLPGGSILIAASVELDDRPGPLRDFVQKAQQDLISNIERAARIAVNEGHFQRNLDCEQFAWSLYSFVLGYHHFSRMLEDPKAELHLMRSVRGLLDFAKTGADTNALGKNARTRANEKKKRNQTTKRTVKYRTSNQKTRSTGG